MARLHYHSVPTHDTNASLRLCHLGRGAWGCPGTAEFHTCVPSSLFVFFFQAEDGIRDSSVTGKSVDLGGRRIIKKKNGVTLVVQAAFGHSCPEFYIFDRIRHLNISYMRLLAGCHKLNVFYYEIDRNPDDAN